MAIQRPFNFMQWIDDHRHLLKPPVGNKVVYEDTEFIIMVVGGPNARKDYHYNEGEEFFYQLEGNINVRIQENGKAVDIRCLALVDRHAKRCISLYMLDRLIAFPRRQLYV